MENAAQSTKPLRTPWPELDDEKKAELQKKHGDLHRLEYDGHFIYVRGPRRPEFREWSASMRRDPDIALENLVKRVTVHPTPAELESHMENFPALGVTFGERVLNIAGAGNAEKKTV